PQCTRFPYTTLFRSDHNAAVQMWDRYNRGDRKAFGRHLYTPHGQRAFDDIRARYRGNRDFRATVDRYIAEFERLLDEVSRDERGDRKSTLNSSHVKI